MQILFLIGIVLSGSLKTNLTMKQHSLLLSSLVQRLALAFVMLAILWGVYFWAVAERDTLPNSETTTEQVTS